MIILSLRIAIVVLATLALTASLRRAPAALRHSLWLSAIVCLSLMPFLPALLPSLEMRVAALPMVQLPLPADDATPVAVYDAQPSSPAPTSTESAARTPSLEIIYYAGVLAVLCWMLLGRIALWRRARRAGESDVAWKTLLDDEAALADLTAPPRLRFSSAVRTPLVHGVLRRTILLPMEAHAWSDARKRTVLRHELAHIARGDTLSQLLAGLVCAVFWFHPLVWFAARRLRAECEHACDDRVLLLGTNASSYAECLVEIARVARHPFIAPAAALSMAHPSRLEERIMQIIEENRRRTHETLLVRAGGFTAAALLVCIVGACSFTRAEAVPSGNVEASASARGPQGISPQADTSASEVIFAIPLSATAGWGASRATPPVDTILRIPKPVDTIIRLPKPSTSYSGVVQSSVPGREIWVELIGSGATVELRSLVDIEHREGRTFFQTPAAITVSADADFTYRLVAVDPLIEDVNLLSPGGHALTGGASVTLTRGLNGVGVQMLGGYASTGEPQTIRLPLDCSSSSYDPGKPSPCYIFQRAVVSPTNEVRRQPTSPNTLRGNGPFTIRPSVREYDFPATIRALRRGS